MKCARSLVHTLKISAPRLQPRWRRQSDRDSDYLFSSLSTPSTRQQYTRGGCLCAFGWSTIYRSRERVTGGHRPRGKGARTGVAGHIHAPGASQGGWVLQRGGCASSRVRVWRGDPSRRCPATQLTSPPSVPTSTPPPPPSPGRIHHITSKMSKADSYDPNKSHVSQEVM